MIQAIEKIQELKLDKYSWKLTKLGDLAEDISKRVDNPSSSKYDRFVGLEHFVSGDIKIKNWGSTENLASSAKAFQAGDILFARRNAYLRRASIVDFNGCCSGDAFVIRENHNKVIPGFLAFLMNSDALWDYANSNAAGTMSKRVKWRDLAEYEFLLPPKVEQAKIAELLWAMDELIEKENELQDRLRKIEWTLILKEFFGKKSHWTLDDLTSEKHGIVDGPFGSNLKTIHYKKEGILVMQSGYVTKGYFEITHPIYVDETKYQEQIRSSAISGDILMAKIGANYGECALIPLGHDKTLIAGNAIRIRVDNKKCLSQYMLQFLKFQKRIGEFEKHVTTTAQPALTISSLKKLKMHLPSFTEQNTFVKRYNSVSDSILNNESKIVASKSIHKSLINQVF
jgi:type I restriction enzyme S subunit